MIVDLTKDEVTFCTQAAVGRWLMKYGSQDRPNYAQGKAEGRLEHNLVADIRTLVAEWAVAKHFNLVWSFPIYPNELHPYRSKFPDVGTDGEVRTIRTQQGIPFWSKDAGKTIYGARVLDADYFSRVELFKPFAADKNFYDHYKDDSINGWRVPVGLLEMTL